MPDPLRPLRLDARELLRSPGAHHHLVASFPPTQLDVEHDQITGPIDVDLHLDVGTDAIQVSGTVEAPWSGRCRRCLTSVAGRAVAEVDERYRPSVDEAADPFDEIAVGVSDDDAYAIDDGRLDLVPMARELILLELDQDRVCRESCAGLCSSCGIDLNSGSCECDTTVRDERWAALDGLVLDD